jgi:5-methyltetrahydropteroyltriglutamate--homocysteine methyltransferase
VKSYYIETPDDNAERVRRCLKYAPDCGLSQTARWASRLKLQNLVKGVKMLRKELGVQ